MAKSFETIPRGSSKNLLREMMTRLKVLEDIVSFLGGATFTFRSGTASGDPGAGNFRLNDAAKALSTAIFVSNITDGGVDVDDIYDGVDPGDQMIIVQESDSGRNLHTTITSVTDNGTWHQFDYTVDAANGAEFQNNQDCLISIIRN